MTDRLNFRNIPLPANPEAREFVIDMIARKAWDVETIKGMALIAAALANKTANHGALDVALGTTAAAAFLSSMLSGIDSEADADLQKWLKVDLKAAGKFNKKDSA